MATVGSRGVSRIFFGRWARGVPDLFLDTFSKHDLL